MPGRGAGLLGLVTFTFLTASACGDGSTAPGTTTAPTPTPISAPRAAFIARADRECAAAHAQLDQRPAPKTLPDTVAYLDTLVQVNGDLEKRLRMLTPPQADAGAVSVVLDDFHALLTKAKAVRGTAAAGDAAATDAGVGDLAKLVSAVSQKAAAFGFRVCGIPASGGSAAGA